MHFRRKCSSSNELLYQNKCKRVKILMMMLPGQLCVLQDCEEVEDPAQEFPPLAGAGLLQDLDRD